MLSLIRHIACVAANGGRYARPPRWALLAVVLTALALLGSREPPDYGEGAGILDDGALVVDMGWRDEHFSADGGYTWQPISNWDPDGWRLVWATGFDEHWEDDVQWGEGEVETPRGRYVIEEMDSEGYHALIDVRIVRADGDAKEVVYAPSHLRKASDRRFRDRQYVANDTWAWEAPRNLVYHPPSGNIVAVLGLEGVVVGDAEDNWRPLLDEIGERAIDVSIRGKTSFALGQALPVAIMIAIAATAAALALAERAHLRGAADGDVFGDLASLFWMGLRGLLILILLIVIHFFVGTLLNGVFDPFNRQLYVSTAQGYIFTALVALLGAFGVWRKGCRWFTASSVIASAAVPMLVAVAVLGFADSMDLMGERNLGPGYVLALLTSIISLAGAFAIWIKTRALVGATHLLVAFIGSAVWLVAVHNYVSYGTVGEFGADLALWAAVSMGALGGVVAIISFARFFWRQLHIVFVALIGMAALIALAFVIGVLQGFNMWAAKLYAIPLVLASGTGLSWYLRRSQRPPEPQ